MKGHVVHHEEVQGPVDTDHLAWAATELIRHGFVHLRKRWPGWNEAKRDSLEIFAVADALDLLGCDLPELSAVGEFVVPPAGAPGRGYQALHVDFGLPVLPERPVDIARFTALHIDVHHPGSNVVTRIVPLRPLLGQREWPLREIVSERLRRSADAEKPVEGILGRIVESVDEGTALPPTTTPGFLCGMEFSSLEEENSYFRSHGMNVSDVEHRIVLQSQEVLLIDNLRTAHARLGLRRAHELHQLFVGYRSLPQDRQRILLDRVLVAFSAA